PAPRPHVQVSPHLRDETVPDARNGLDEDRLFPAVSQHGAQAIERDVETVIEVDRRIRPQPRADLVARHEAPGVFEQQDQEREWLTAEAKGLSPASQAPRGVRKLERCELRHHWRSPRIVTESPND